jgi:hypothetical protein
MVAFQLTQLFPLNLSDIIDAFMTAIGFRVSTMIDFLISPETMTVPGLDGGFLALLMQWLKASSTVRIYIASCNKR